MRAVWLEVPETFLAERRRLGHDKFDEVWEGVLHMVPPPMEWHQTLKGALFGVFLQFLRRSRLGRLTLEVGVRPPGSGVDNFRVPDITFVSAGRLDIVAEGWVNGGPDLIVEVLSPNDETYEKKPFYAKLGIAELVIVEPKTCRIELCRLSAGKYSDDAADAEGWLRLQALKVVIRTGVAGGKPVVVVRDEATGEVLDTRDTV